VQPDIARLITKTDVMDVVSSLMITISKLNCLTHSNVLVDWRGKPGGFSLTAFRFLEYSRNGATGTLCGLACDARSHFVRAI
jgi:hypothetical protein